MPCFRGTKVCEASSKCPKKVRPRPTENAYEQAVVEDEKEKLERVGKTKANQHSSKTGPGYKMQHVISW